MLSLPVLSMIEKVLNRYIQLDPSLAEKLLELNGKVLGLSIIGLNSDVYILFNPDRIFLQSTCLGGADLHIQAPPFTLIELIQSNHPQKLFNQDNVQVKGDVILAQKIRQFFQSLNIDCEYYLSLITGDMIASQSSGFIKNQLDRIKKASQYLRRNIGEYLQEEINVTPPVPALEFFYNEVDKLRIETDLLQARISELRRIMKRSSHESD